MLWPTSQQSSLPAPTPQQNLAAQVSADMALMASVLKQLLGAVETIAGHCYASAIGNGTPDETFGPGDYLAAVQAASGNGSPTAVQLLQISAATLGFVQTLATIQPPPVPLTLPPIPPAGITLGENPDGSVPVTGTTPLQQAQAALIAAKATQAANLATLQATVTTTTAVRTAAYVARSSPTDPTWVAADRVWQNATAALAAAQQSTDPLAQAVATAHAAVTAAQG